MLEGLRLEGRGGRGGVGGSLEPARVWGWRGRGLEREGRRRVGRGSERVGSGRGQGEGIGGRGGALESRDLTPEARGVPGRRLAVTDRCCPLRSGPAARLRLAALPTASVGAGPKAGKVPAAVGMGQSAPPPPLLPRLPLLSSGLGEGGQARLGSLEDS